MNEFVIWTWDPGKDEANRRRHGISLSTAGIIFDDPFLVSEEDPYPFESRWRTFGLIAGVLTVVVHTLPEREPETGLFIGRLISARRADAHERRIYEQG